MVILETPIFARRVTSLMPDEDYRELQFHLASRPDAGKLIPGSGGLRKIRWSLGSHGKRGGVRTIYYWAVAQEKILMLMVYSKTEQDDLTPDQLRVLKQVVREEFKQ